jgi:GAF domain-containing protein
MGLPVDTLKVLKILSVMCVPLIYRSQILGAIYVDCHSGLRLRSNSNLEIRNSKQIQNSNAPRFKTETQQPTALVI